MAVLTECLPAHLHFSSTHHLPTVLGLCTDPGTTWDLPAGPVQRTVPSPLNGSDPLWLSRAESNSSALTGRPDRGMASLTWSTGSTSHWSHGGPAQAFLPGGRSMGAQAWGATNCTSPEPRVRQHITRRWWRPSPQDTEHMDQAPVTHLGIEPRQVRWEGERKEWYTCRHIHIHTKCVYMYTYICTYTVIHTVGHRSFHSTTTPPQSREGHGLHCCTIPSLQGSPWQGWSRCLASLLHWVSAGAWLAYCTGTWPVAGHGDAGVRLCLVSPICPRRLQTGPRRVHRLETSHPRQCSRGNKHGSSTTVLGHCSLQVLKNFGVAAVLGYS